MILCFLLTILKNLLPRVYFQEGEKNIRSASSGSLHGQLDITSLLLSTELDAQGLRRRAKVPAILTMPDRRPNVSFRCLGAQRTGRKARNKGSHQRSPRLHVEVCQQPKMASTKMIRRGKVVIDSCGLR